MRHFHNKSEHILSLFEKVKLQVYWWFKSYYDDLNFEYSVWRLNHLLCF